MALTKVTGEFIDISDLDLSDVGTISLDAIQGDADANTSITFSGSDVITIATGGSGRLTIGDGALSPVTDNQIDLGTASLEFKDAFFDGTVTADAFAGPLTGNVTGNASGTAATVTGAAQSAITSVGTLTTLTVDDITINGSTISDAGDLTLDVAGDIILDADTGDIHIQDGGVETLRYSSSGDGPQFYSPVSDKDIIFKGNDGGSTVTALTLDMSAAGAATFNSTVTASGLTVGNSNIGSNTSHLANLTINNNSYIGSVGNTSAIKIATSGAVTMGYADLTITADNARLLVEEADGTNIAWVGDHTGDGHGGLLLYNHGGTATVKLTADSHANYINNGNSFGIGTGSPAYPLDVSFSGHSGIRAISTSGDSRLYLTSDGSANASSIFFGDDAAATIGGLVYDHNVNALKINTNDAERMKITADGDVGIGCTPGSGTRLEIRDTANSAIMELSGTDGRGLKLFTGKSDYPTNSGQNDAAVIYDAQDTEASSVYGQHIFQTGGTTRMQIDKAGVGIGTASPAKLLTINATSDGALQRFSRQGVCDWDVSIGNTPHISGGSSGDLEILPQNGNMGFAVGRAGSTGLGMRVRDGIITSGTGIKFNAETADASFLDDYEEGTWTAALKDTSQTAATMSVSACHYTKIGRMVYIYGQLRTSSISGLSGEIRIYGLPFTASAGWDTTSGVTIDHALYMNITAGQVLSAWVHNNSTYFDMSIWDHSGGSSYMDISEWSSDGQIMFSGQYSTAS